MKADLFLLAAAACMAGMFCYTFVGGLVVRLWNALPNTESIVRSQIPTAASLWPLLLVAVAGLTIGQLLNIALRLSQWRLRHKPTLPGARVVRHIASQKERR